LVIIVKEDSHINIPNIYSEKSVGKTNAMEDSGGQKETVSLEGSRVDEILLPSEITSEKEKAMKGQPVQIVEISDEDHSFKLNEEALIKILSNEKVKDLPVCVVSVAGAFRRGKSFLLDFFLRYLSRDEDSWMGDDSDDNTPLEGFHWRGGSERDTTGILIWSEVFTAHTRKGKQVAIVLMDTQGAFDCNSTVRDCATIFALSAMISSVLVYNLSQNIQEDDLQHLQLFTEYGRLAVEDTGDTPFQRLQFLVRDWSCPYEYEYGAEGGRKILDKRLQVSDRQHVELQNLRKHIDACFDKIEAFLLPHPGLRVATDPNFDGKLKDIEKEFIKQLKDFIPMLLSPENALPRKISGAEVKCKDLSRYMRAYVDIFKGDEMPEPKSMLEATSEANNLASLSEAKDLYTNMMEGVCGGDKPFINEHILEIEHLRIRDAALETFDSRRKMGGEEFSAKYRDKLEVEMNEAFENYKSHNESKNLFRAANTPITLGAIAMILYILSQLFSIFGLYPIANILNLLMLGAILLLSTWGYIRYSGNFSELGEGIDTFANSIWEQGLAPLFELTVEKGAEMASKHVVQRQMSTVTPPSAAMSVKKHS